MKPSIAGSNNSVAFVSLHNSNKAELVIVGANVVSSQKPNASSIANRIELHNSFTDTDGVSKMTQVNRLIVPIDGHLTMEPGGTHIMLFDMKKVLKEGDIVFVNLIIQGLGTYQVQVPVKSTD
jgi:copper(I)-binding protein